MRLLHRSLRVPEIWEMKSKKGERTGGIYGFFNSFTKEIKSVVGYYPIVVWDAGLSKRRTDIYPYYKRNNEREMNKLISSLDDGVISQDELYSSISASLLITNDAEMNLLKNLIADTINKRTIHTDDIDDYLTQYRLQRTAIIDILSKLGVPSIMINGWEGDDLVKILTDISEQSIVMTDDKDMIQLISPNVDIYRPMADTYLTYESYLKDNDYDSVREIMIYKAIVGDGSDNIPSVTSGNERKYSVGSVRAKSLAKLIASCDENPDEYLPKIKEINKNYSEGFIQRHDDYIRNKNLVDLSLVTYDDTILNEIDRLVTISYDSNSVGFLQLVSEFAKYDIVKLDISSLSTRLQKLKFSFLHE